jgi:hypothetical protein
VHIAGIDRAGGFEKAIRERGLTVVDVGDDAKIAYSITSLRHRP